MVACESNFRCTWPTQSPTTAFLLHPHLSSDTIFLHGAVREHWREGAEGNNREGCNEMGAGDRGQMSLTWMIASDYINWSLIWKPMCSGRGWFILCSRVSEALGVNRHAYTSNAQTASRGAIAYTSNAQTDWIDSAAGICARVRVLEVMHWWPIPAIRGWQIHSSQGLLIFCFCCGLHVCLMISGKSLVSHTLIPISEPCLGSFTALREERETLPGPKHSFCYKFSRRERIHQIVLLAGSWRLILTLGDDTGR